MEALVFCCITTLLTLHCHIAEAHAPLGSKAILHYKSPIADKDPGGEIDDLMPGGGSDEIPDAGQRLKRNAKFVGENDEKNVRRKNSFTLKRNAAEECPEKKEEVLVEETDGGCVYASMKVPKFLDCAPTMTCTLSEQRLPGDCPYNCEG